MHMVHQGLSLNAEGLESGEAEIGLVCIPNISPREQRRRLIVGVSQFAISLVVLAVLIARGQNRWWRLPLFLLFWGAGVGFFQWRDKT